LKAILISPFEQKISQIEFEAGSNSIIQLLNPPEKLCVDVFLWKDHLIVSSLQGHVDKKHTFRIRGYRYPLAGKAVITGPFEIRPITRGGFLGTSDCTLSCNEVDQHVEWLGFSVIRPTTQNWIDWSQTRYVYGDYPAC
jgi:hypothetical protein